MESTNQEDYTNKQSFDVNSFLAKTLSNFSETAQSPRLSEPRAKSLPPKQADLPSSTNLDYNNSCTVLNYSNNNNNYTRDCVGGSHGGQGQVIVGRQQKRTKRSNNHSSQNHSKKRRPRKSESSSSRKVAANAAMRLNEENENSRLINDNQVAMLHNTPIAHSVSSQRLPGPMMTSSIMANVSSITPSPSKNSLASAASSLRPLCRICQMAGGDGPHDQLISPCRCAGSMLYVHTSCLVHWLEISTRKMCPTPQCELCGYEYKTHHCLRFQKLHMPRCSQRDKILHVVFIIVMLVMLGCAALCVMYLKNDPGNKVRTSLDPDDIIVITCSVLFFCAFFVAVFTQYRAEASICRLFFRSWLINKHWRIRNYDAKDDWIKNERLAADAAAKTQV